jgi:hypothetical protein
VLNKVLAEPKLSTTLLHAIRGRATRTTGDPRHCTRAAVARCKYVTCPPDSVSISGAGIFKRDALAYTSSVQRHGPPRRLWKRLEQVGESEVLGVKPPSWPRDGVAVSAELDEVDEPKRAIDTNGGHVADPASSPTVASPHPCGRVARTFASNGKRITAARGSDPLLEVGLKSTTRRIPSLWLTEGLT